MVRKPLFKVEVNGVDYTSRFQPLVKQIEVNDRSGVATDTASILLADRDGSIRLPGEGDRMRIALGDTLDGIGLVFSGFISDVESQGSKGGGRELNLQAKGIDPRSEARSPQGQHLDDTTLGDAAKQFAKKAGIDGVVIPRQLANIQRPYWAMQFESFLHWGQRVADEVGATFKMQDGKAIFVPTNAGKSAGGVSLPALTAAWGVNLLSWRISPVFSRPRYGKIRTRYYDDKKAKWVEREVDVDEEGVGTYTDRFTSADEAAAQQRAESLKGRSERNSGVGSVAIVGTATAKPEAPLTLVGARPGIDGSYLIDSVTHRVVKRGGYTVSCDVRRPSGEAGKDGRKATSGTTATSPAYASTAATSSGRAAGPV